MEMNNFRFNKEDKVIIENKPDEVYIIIGRGDFIGQPNRYVTGTK